MFQWTLPCMHESIRLCTSQNTRFNRMWCHHQIMAESILRLASNQVFWIPGLCVPRQPHSALNRYWYTHSPREKIICKKVNSIQMPLQWIVQGEDITDLAVLWSLKQEEIPTTLISTASRCRWWGQLCQYWKWSKPECFCLGTTLLDVQHTTTNNIWQTGISCLI